MDKGRLMNIVLIGVRGVGKSTIARRLAVLTNRPVLSTDLLISYDNGGLSIPALLAARNGDWRAFRDLEYQVLQKTAAMDNLILDTGGGVVVDLDDQGREIFSQRKVAALRQNGAVIWLKGNLAVAARRVAGDANRPDLHLRQSEMEVMKRREPFYQQAADLVIDMEEISPKEQANKIFQVLPFQPVV